MTDMPAITTHTSTSVPDTTATDSAAVDSNALQLAPQYLDGFPDSATCDTTIAPMSELPTMSMPLGQKPVPFTTSPLHDTSCMALMLTGLLLIVVSYRTGYKYLENLAHNMFSTRRRENLFEDHTLNETQILTALTLNTCIMEGLLIFLGIDTFVPGLRTSLHSQVFLHVGIFTAAALVFYLVQLAVYHLIGHVFSDGVNSKLWTDGFKATQSLLGMLLFPVVGIALTAPHLANVMLICAISLYFIARIVFICKGFRIFYINLPSLVYFILYLCAVEIVPIVIICAGMVFLCNLLQ